MEIENYKIDIIVNDDTAYNKTSICQCCGKTITPTIQGNGLSYYYTVNDREIDPQCMGIWLGRLGAHLAANPHSTWLHAVINHQ